MPGKKEDNYTSFDELYDNESIPDTNSEIDKDVISEYDYEVKKSSWIFNKTVINVILSLFFILSFNYSLNTEFYLKSEYKNIIKIVVLFIMSGVSFIVNYFF